MDKLLIRLTIIYTVVYFLTVYVCAWFGIEYFNDFYIVAFEGTVCVIMSRQGKYHCKYLKYAAYGAVTSDTITRLDACYDMLSFEWCIAIPLSIMAVGVGTSFFMALRHFYKVKQLKRKQNEIHRRRAE